MKTDSFCQRIEFNSVNDNDNGNKLEKRERNGNGKINNWNWINIVSVFVVQLSPTLYDKTPCTRCRRMYAYTYKVYVGIRHIKFPVLGRTTWVVRLVCIISAITQTVATVWF